MHTAKLLNCVYGKEFFWDGRATGLEELLETSFRDNSPLLAENRVKRHGFDHAIDLVRQDEKLADEIKSVFGERPNAENVSRCLATYLRTLLCGNSLQDRAEQARKERRGDTITVDDYEKVLDADAIVALDRIQQLQRDGAEKLDPTKKAEVARQLHLGYTLFNGKARCIRCHDGQDYTDRSYHNLGIRQSARSEKEFLPGHEPGRYAALCARSKEPPDASAARWFGAYRTPTLRGLGRSAPYFHDGAPEMLFLVVLAHVKPTPLQENKHLDPDLLDNGKPINLDISDSELHALVLFLLALEGEPTDDVLTKMK
jgi:cytochrome c peroxidase